MMPYFNCPFYYINKMNMPPVYPAANVPMQPMQPIQQMQPMQQQMQPMQQQMQPVQQMQSIPPLMQPGMPYTQPMQTEFLPSGQQTEIMTPEDWQSGMPVMPGMEDMYDMYNMGGTGLMEDTEYPESEMVRDPQPVLSNNPATLAISLFKELTGYPNYGNPSGNADILYTRTRGNWTFELPSTIGQLGNLRVQLIIRAVLDDHANVAERLYTANISVNGDQVHTGRVPLEHGRPVGGRFNNWISLTFNVRNVRRSNRVTIVNTSNAGENDWIGLDWMEMRILPRRT
jgi:hypothetical protein